MGGHKIDRDKRKTDRIVIQISTADKDAIFQVAAVNDTTPSEMIRDEYLYPIIEDWKRGQRAFRV